VQDAGEVLEVLRCLLDTDDVVEVAEQPADGLGEHVDRRP